MDAGTWILLGLSLLGLGKTAAAAATGTDPATGLPLDTSTPTGFTNTQATVPPTTTTTPGGGTTGSGGGAVVTSPPTQDNPSGISISPLSAIGTARKLALEALDPDSMLNSKIIPGLAEIFSPTPPTTIDPASWDAWFADVPLDPGVIDSAASEIAAMANLGVTEAGFALAPEAAVQGIAALSVLKSLGPLLSIAGAGLAIAQGNIGQGIGSLALAGIGWAAVVAGAPTGFGLMLGAIGLAMGFMGGGDEQVKNQIREHADILKGMAIAWPQEMQGVQAAWEGLARARAALAGTGAIPAEWATLTPVPGEVGPGPHDERALVAIASLEGVVDLTFTGIAAEAAVAHFYGTQGGKEGAAHIAGADTSWLIRPITFAPGHTLTLMSLVEMDLHLGNMRAQDGLVRLGALPVGGLYNAASWSMLLRAFEGRAGIHVSLFGVGDPANADAWLFPPMLPALYPVPFHDVQAIEYEGGPPYPLRLYDIPEWGTIAYKQGVKLRLIKEGMADQILLPGVLEDEVVRLFTRLNPAFASSDLGVRMAQMPALGLPLDLEALRIFRTVTEPVLSSAILARLLPYGGEGTGFQ